MPEQATELATAPAMEQRELALARRRWRGRVLAWLALAVWLAALSGAYQAAWRPQTGQPEAFRTLDSSMLGCVLLGFGGLLGAVLAYVGVRQARRDVLAWIAFALNLAIAFWGVGFYLTVRLLTRA